MKRKTFSRIFFAVCGIALFIFSIQLLKSTTASIFPLFNDYLSFVNSPLNALGFGWFSSYVILSGSPVAALTLSLMNSGLLDSIPTFFMLIGSRLGATFILIVIGLVESFRGKGNLMDTTSIAFLTFFVTYTISFPALFIGFGLLKMDLIGIGFELKGAETLLNFYVPLTKFFIVNFGKIITFLLSMLFLYFSLSIFERAFRDIKVTKAKSSWINYLMEKPYFSFVFGALITLVGQSVSLSLGIMIPLYLKGFIQRRNLIPYIMGSNITTFVDTFFVAILLGNPSTVNIVNIAIFSTIIPTLIALAFYRYYYNFVTGSVNFLIKNKIVFVLFTLFLLLFPLFLLFL